MSKFKKDKIIFSDLDSTLLNGDGFFSNVTKQMVKECYEKGVLFIPLTARSTDDVFRQAKRLGIDKLGGISGANNGSQIYDFGAKKWIKNAYLPHEVVAEIFKATFQRYLAKVHYFSDDATLVYAKGKNSLYWAQMMGSDYVIVDDVKQLDVPISHLTIVLKKQLTHLELEIINREVFDKIKGKVDINRYSERVFDICPIGVSKGHAVDDIIAYLGWDKTKLHSYAFGDGVNDIPMFNEVDTGIAMDNAILELKEVADDITSSYVNDGVAEYVHSHILK